MRRTCGAESGAHRKAKFAVSVFGKALRGRLEGSGAALLCRCAGLVVDADGYVARFDPALLGFACRSLVLFAGVRFVARAAWSNNLRLRRAAPAQAHMYGA